MTVIPVRDVQTGSIFNAILLLIFFVLAGLGVKHPANSTVLCASSALLGTEDKSTPGDLTTDIPATDRLLSYLKVLLEQGVFHEVEIQEFQALMKSGQGGAPLLPGWVPGWVHSGDHYITKLHKKNILHILHSSRLQADGLEGILQNILREIEQREAKQITINRRTNILYRQINFHPIKPGMFLRMNSETLIQAPHLKYFSHWRKVVPVYLTQPFEVMDAPMTQAQWIELMGENPALHCTGEQQDYMVSRSGKTILCQPDHFLESVSWFSAAVALNKMSVQQGFEPIYDFSQVKFRPGTSAEKGNLVTATPEDRMKIRLNAPGGNIYLAKGYRFPTLAELEFLLRLRGRYKGTAPLNYKQRDTYAYHEYNSGKVSQAFDSKKPHKIHGNLFYGLYGHIYPWTHDYQSASQLGGINPQSDYSNLDTLFTLRSIGIGGSYMHNPTYIDFTKFNSEHNSGREFVGIRAVRSLF